MRGDGIEPQAHMWSYMPLEQRIPADHPLRPMRAMVDAILQELSPQFDQLYSEGGAAVDPAGAVAARAAAAGAVLACAASGC